MTLNHPNQKPVDDKDEVDEVLGNWLEWLPLEVTELVDITQEQWSELKKDLNAHYQKKYLGLLLSLKNGKPHKAAEPNPTDLALYIEGYNNARTDFHQAIDEALANMGGSVKRSLTTDNKHIVK